MRPIARARAARCLVSMSVVVAVAYFTFIIGFFFPAILDRVRNSGSTKSSNETANDDARKCAASKSLLATNGELAIGISTRVDGAKMRAASPAFEAPLTMTNFAAAANGRKRVDRFVCGKNERSDCRHRNVIFSAPHDSALSLRPRSGSCTIGISPSAAAASSIAFGQKRAAPFENIAAAAAADETTRPPPAKQTMRGHATFGGGGCVGRIGNITMLGAASRGLAVAPPSPVIASVWMPPRLNAQTLDAERVELAAASSSQSADEAGESTSRSASSTPVTRNGHHASAQTPAACNGVAARATSAAAAAAAAATNNANAAAATSPPPTTTHCTLCDQTYATIADYQLHQYADHATLRDGKDYRCPRRRCDKLYPNRMSLRAHLRTHFFGGIGGGSTNSAASFAAAATPLDERVDASTTALADSSPSPSKSDARSTSAFDQAASSSSSFVQQQQTATQNGHLEVRISGNKLLFSIQKICFIDKNNSAKFVAAVDANNRRRPRLHTLRSRSLLRRRFRLAAALVARSFGAF